MTLRKMSVTLILLTIYTGGNDELDKDSTGK